MQRDDTTPITTLEPRERPTAKQIIDELKEAIIAAGAMGVFARLLRCHNTRECMWRGREDDGRLGTADSELPVFRWKGAPDLRIPLADKILRWLGMLRMSVYNRGDLRIGPRKLPEKGAQAAAGGALSGTELAAVWQGTMEYFTCVQDWQLSKHYELFGICVEEFGYGLIMVDWLKKFRQERCEVTLQQLTDVLTRQAQDALFAQALEAAGPGVEVDPAAVLTEEAQAMIVQGVAENLEMMLAMAGSPNAEQLGAVMAVDARMTESEARKVLGTLRREPTEGAVYFAPKEEGGVFEVQGLVPWVNCLHPYDLAGDGRGDWIALPKYWSEAKVRERAQAEGWNKAGVKKLIETQKNKFFTELYQGDGNIPAWAMNGVGVGLEPDVVAMEKLPRWLVVYVWKKVTNRLGQPMIYKAVVHPNLPEDLLLWEATDLRELPVVCDTAEPVLYAMMSKGACDVIVDKQNFVKDGMDSEGARGQLGSNPPLLRTGGQNVGLRPGLEMYAKRSGTSYDGTKFLEVPVVDQGALKLMEKAELLVEQYYFRSVDTSEADQQMFKEHVIFKSLRCYRELMRLVWEQVQENVGEVQVSRINGREIRLEANRDQLQGEADIHIGIHLEAYSKDGAKQFADVLGQLIQSDRGGNIDWNEATNIAAQLLSPTYARRLILTSEAANGKTIDDQENRIAKIMAGVPVRYEERVSNPELRMQVLTQWAEQPGNIERAQTQPLVAEMLNKEQEMLDFQKQQQVTNPVIGRTGAKPNG